jgi:CheY-like chemotaxis protein
MDKGTTSWSGERARERPTDRKPRVLIIDDEPLIGATLRLLLLDAHDVDVVGSGEDAKERLESGERYDVILCDLMMPAPSGMDLHAWLASSGSELADRMIFMSGGVFTEEAQAFLERVPNPRVDKPFDHEHLLELIREVYNH